MSEEPPAPTPDDLSPPPPDITLRSGEEGYIQDSAKAEAMAYAEKPHRDDALTLEGLRQRAMNVLDTMDSEWRDPKLSSNEQTKLLINHNDQRDHVMHLDTAKEHSLWLARNAAEKAEKRYEQEQK